MLKKVKWAAMLLMGAMLLFTASFASAAAQTKKIDAEVNRHTVKLDGKAFSSNVLYYKGTLYLPIKDIGRMFDLEVNVYPEKKTVYLGMLPAGEVPDAVINKWEKAAKTAKPAKTALLPKVKGKVDAVLNSYKVKIHGIALTTDTVQYGGLTFASVKSVSSILDVPFAYHGRTSTYYVGKISKEIAYSINSPLYAVPAGGEYKGWQVLKGHKYEKTARILFQYDGQILSTKIEDIRKVDLNKKITWTDQNGNKRTNTVKAIYEMFSELSGPYTSDYLHKTFGDLYADWLSSSTIVNEARQLIDDYLIGTGKMKAPANNILLTPDAEFEPAS